LSNGKTVLVTNFVSSTHDRNPASALLIYMIGHRQV